MTEDDADAESSSGSPRQQLIAGILQRKASALNHHFQGNHIRQLPQMCPLSRSDCEPQQRRRLKRER